MLNIVYSRRIFILMFNFSFQRSQAELSCVIALTRIIVKHLNLSPTVIEGFCAILDHQVSDWLEQVNS